MDIKVENVKSQMRKGYLEYCILLIISKKPAYVSDIINELKEAKMIVVEGTLYPLLSRLKNNGILSYQWQESLSGPPRKYYELTEKGQIFLSELESGWEELTNAIQLLRTKKDIVKI
jgi:PadR family transcriptional regulator PadR